MTGAGDCWLARFDTRGRPCGGRMDNVHLIDQQKLRKEGHGGLCTDGRSFVQACRTHHAAFDNYRGVVVPRAMLPAGLEELCGEVGLLWWLDRRYGKREEAGCLI